MNNNFIIFRVQFMVIIAQAGGENLWWFPPYPLCVADASPRFRFENNNFMKKSLKKISGKYCKFDSKRVARWVDELSIMCIMPSMKGGNYWFR
jgi:hypothetical protein